MLTCALVGPLPSSSARYRKKSFAGARESAFSVSLCTAPTALRLSDGFGAVRLLLRKGKEPCRHTQRVVPKKGVLVGLVALVTLVSFLPGLVPLFSASVSLVVFHSAL